MYEQLNNLPTLKPLSVEQIYCPPASAEGSDTPSERSWDQMNLRERSQILNEALGYLEKATDEEMEIIFDMEEGVKDKLISTAYVCRKFDQAADIILSEAETIMKQIEELEQRALIFQKRSERIKQRMKEAMCMNNIKRIETPLLTLLLRKIPQKLVMDRSVLADQYEDESPIVRVKKEFNRREILRQLKEGKQIEGFSLSEPDFSVSIKT